MSIHDLRAAFAASDELPRWIRSFREERIATIEAGRTPVPIASTARCLIHVIPASAADPRNTVDLHRLEREHQLLQVIHGSSYQRFNLDGFVRYSSRKQSAAYVMMFRNGALEALMPADDWARETERLWFSHPIESALLEYLHTYVDTVEKLGGSRPIFVMMTLIGVDAYRLFLPESANTGEDFSFDRNILRLPEVVLDVDSEPNIVEQLMNDLWQCAGLSDRRDWAKPR